MCSCPSVAPQTHFRASQTAATPTAVFAKVWATQKRRKQGSYDDSPPRQSPTIVHEHWRPIAASPHSETWRAITSKTTGAGAGVHILKFFNNYSLNCACLDLLGRGLVPLRARKRTVRSSHPCNANFANPAPARELSGPGEREPHEDVPRTLKVQNRSLRPIYIFNVI